MGKELEAFETVYNNIDYLISDVVIEDNEVSGCLMTIKEQLPTIEQALKRLEAIDNANPSEALECLEWISSELKIYYEHLYIVLRDSKEELISNMKKANEYLAPIKQALLKAQDPKNYLKWEDLEFKHTPKTIDVKMGENKYTLNVGCNVHFDKLAILKNGKINYYFLEADKQFFNDLHLDRVEE